jgi:hypothetical protein
MVHADEGACLNEVIAYFLGHEHGHSWVYGNDCEAIAALIPAFAAIVSNLIRRGLVEIRELPAPASQWEDAPLLESALIPDVLADPHTWIPARGQPHRHVMIAKTDRPNEHLVDSTKR